MKLIPLTKGKRARVDDADFAWLSQWRWSADVKPKNCYAVRKVRTPGGPRLLTMSRALMGLGFDDKRVVDFVDGDSLNCTRRNLRICTKRSDCWRQRRGQRSRSGLRGVYWEAGRKRWKASIVDNGRCIHLGRFPTKEEAAAAFDRAVRELRDRHALTNADL